MFAASMVGKRRMSAAPSARLKALSKSCGRLSRPNESAAHTKEHLDKVFDRFHRIDNRDTRKAGGTGIGLYLVKHLVEAHGGKIWVESEVDKGSEFFFELPECPPQFVDEEGGDGAAASDSGYLQPGMRPPDLHSEETPAADGESVSD